MQKALEFGADIAGIACISDLTASPSELLYKKVGGWVGVGNKCKAGNESPEEPQEIDGIVRQAEIKSFVVIAGHHPQKEPVLDWWQRKGQPGGTKGNLELIRVSNRLIKWFNKEYGVKTTQVPYLINKGGVFLKDAAVIAGLGVIGKNNLLITKKFGPRVRLRALGIPFELASTGLVDFDPCRSCGEPCRSACPENVFSEEIYPSGNDARKNCMPGKDGSYDRNKCQIQMERDLDGAESLVVETENVPEETIRIHYCRRCEFACPVGRK